MEDPVGTERRDHVARGGPVAEVGLEQGYAVAHLGEVLLLRSPPHRARDLVPQAQAVLGEVTADEAGDTGYEDAHSELSRRGSGCGTLRN